MALIGGVPDTIVRDNIMPPLNKATKHDSDLNPSTADFSEHY